MSSDELEAASVITDGDRRQALGEMRKRLGFALVNATGREVASISRELRAVLAELDALPDAGEETPLDRISAAVGDELAARRAHRGATAAGS